MKKEIRIGIVIFCVVFNLLTWMSRAFSDIYTDHIFPLWGKTYGRFTSLFPFSVGEWAIIFGLLWLAVLVIRLIFYTFNKEGAKKMFSHTIDIVLCIAVIMSLNCFVLYHCTPVDVNADSRTYSKAELAALRDLVVSECNLRATQIQRDDSGIVEFAGDPGEEARSAMDSLGRRLFPRMSGYSVKPKIFFFSDFVSQQYMMGYYFPFTMEANINGRMEIMNRPFTMCHELAHTHGYLYEDEANLMGFLACQESDDPAFNYSGYLGILPYVDNDFRKNVSTEEYGAHPAISDQVRRDLQFLSDESWNEVEENAVLDTELVHSAADTFIDQNQKLNGISAGKASYTHVVALLLSYYSGEASYLSS